MSSLALISLDWVTVTHNRSLTAPAPLWLLPPPAREKGDGVPLVIGNECQFGATAIRKPVAPKFHCHSEPSDTQIPLPLEIECHMIQCDTRHGLDSIQTTTKAVSASHSTATRKLQTTTFNSETLSRKMHLPFKFVNGVYTVCKRNYIPIWWHNTVVHAYIFSTCQMWPMNSRSYIWAKLGVWTSH